MNPEMVDKYLAEGGTDLRHLLEHLVEHCADPVAVARIEKLFDNIENEWLIATIEANDYPVLIELAEGRPLMPWRSTMQARGFVDSDATPSGTETALPGHEEG